MNNNEEKPIEQAGSKSEADDGPNQKRLEILALFGTIDFDPTYDYKTERKR